MSDANLIIWLNVQMIKMVAKYGHKSKKKTDAIDKIQRQHLGDG